MILNVIDYIPVGHKNAVTRQYLITMTGFSDRTVRIRKKLSEIKKYARSQNEVEKNQISIFDCMGGGSDG